MVKGKDKKPVVLQVLPELETGGVELGTIEVASELTKHGIKNFVASKGGRMEHELQKLGVPHLTLNLKRGLPETAALFVFRSHQDFLYSSNILRLL